MLVFFLSVLFSVGFVTGCSSDGGSDSNIDGYIITYKSEKGYSAPKSKTVTPGYELRYFDLPQSISGYQVSRWYYYDENCVKVTAASGTVINRDITLYPVFTHARKIKYTVLVDGISSTDTKYTKLIPENKYVALSYALKSTDLPSVTAPSGYVFKGYYSDGNGTTTITAGDTSYTKSSYTGDYYKAIYCLFNTVNTGTITLFDSSDSTYQVKGKTDITYLTLGNYKYQYGTFATATGDVTPEILSGYPKNESLSNSGFSTLGTATGTTDSSGKSNYAITGTVIKNDAVDIGGTSENKQTAILSGKPFFTITIPVTAGAKNITLKKVSGIIAQTQTNLVKLQTNGTDTGYSGSKEFKFENVSLNKTISAGSSSNVTIALVASQDWAQYGSKTISVVVKDIVFDVDYSN